jgi:hypothetical protein
MATAKSKVKAKGSDIIENNMVIYFWKFHFIIIAKFLIII